MTNSESKSKARVGGRDNVDPIEGLRLFRAYLAIANPDARASALDYLERLAATQQDDTTGPLQ